MLQQAKRVIGADALRLIQSPDCILEIDESLLRAIHRGRVVNCLVKVMAFGRQ